MLTLSPAVRIYIATGATDLRRSIDGLSGLVREQLALDPLLGHLFLFRNRRGDRLKVLAPSWRTALVIVKPEPSSLGIVWAFACGGRGRVVAGTDDRPFRPTSAK
jgi:hypothetical protein